MVKNISGHFQKGIIILSLVWMNASCSFSSKTTLKYFKKAEKQQYEMIVKQIDGGIDPPTIENYVNEDNQVFQLRNQVSAIEIELCGMTIRVAPGSDEATLRAVLQAAKAVS